MIVALLLVKFAVWITWVLFATATRSKRSTDKGIRPPRSCARTGARRGSSSRWQQQVALDYQRNVAPICGPLKLTSLKFEPDFKS